MENKLSVNTSLSAYKLMKRREELEYYLKCADIHLEGLCTHHEVTINCSWASAQPIRLDQDLAEYTLKESISRAKKELSQVCGKLEAVEAALSVMANQEAKVNG